MSRICEKQKMPNKGKHRPTHVMKQQQKHGIYVSQLLKRDKTIALKNCIKVSCFAGSLHEKWLDRKIIICFVLIPSLSKAL